MSTTAANLSAKQTKPAAIAPRWTPARSAAGHHSPWLITLILSIATFMEVLDTSIANVSLHNIGGSLSATTDESTWVLTSYLVANAIILPVSGWLATIIGRKRFYMSCVAIFTVSSLLCGLAPSLGWLIFFRVVQGLGGGGLVPCEQSMLADTFPPEKRGMAFAFYGIAVVVAPTLGPTLGGWITDSFSWHWIFLINVPVGLLSLFLAWQFVHEPKALVEERQQMFKKGLRIDYVGFALVALGLASLEVMLSNGQRYDWFESMFIRGFGLSAAVCLISAVVWEWHAKDPVVDVRLVSNRTFGIALTMMFVLGFTLYSSTTLLPILLQSSHGYTAMLSGMVLTPGGMATLLFMPLVGLLTHKVQLRYLAAVGLMIQIIALYHMSGFAADLSFNHAMWARIFQGAGLGFLFIPITTLSYHGLPLNKNNVGSSMLSVMRNIGGSVGIALTNTWLVQRTQYHHSVLAEQINPYNPVLRNALGGMEGMLDPAGAATAAVSPQTLVAVNQMITRQAAMISFNDVARWLALIIVIPLLLIPLMAAVKSDGKTPVH
ncbi:MAG: DHA2 family efflux MFS transporter permease subunit [Phycisphaeraceae bacterium]|nr:DHA2 family efflux MFS transporter permease subunit [Phycisphaeraceae bacterium]